MLFSFLLSVLRLAHNPLTNEKKAEQVSDGYGRVAPSYMVAMMKKKKTFPLYR